MWSNYIQLYLISIFILQSIGLGPNIVCNDQLNRARVSVFSRLMSAISMSQWKCKRLSNINHVLGSYAVKLPNNYSSSWRSIHRQASITEMLFIPYWLHLRNKTHFIWKHCFLKKCGISSILRCNQIFGPDWIIVFLGNVESFLNRDASTFLEKTIIQSWPKSGYIPI